jgi:hypothetical protein
MNALFPGILHAFPVLHQQEVHPEPIEASK